MPTSTFNPASGLNSPVDGDAFRFSSGGESWATIRAGAGTGADPSAASQFSPNVEVLAAGGNFRTLTRGIILFDTSSLPANATITSATFSIWIISKGDSWTDGGLCLVSSAPASNANIATTDFPTANFGTTEYATRVTLASITTGQYLDMALNASGLTFINTPGIQKFGLMISYDLDNTSKATTAGFSANVDVDYADNGSNIPKLAITYTTPTTTATPTLLFMGAG